MKTFTTSGTGGGQTISEIETDKIPVYNSKEDVEADLANLTEGQIVATADTGDELSQPVDVVEEDNLHAVTSNAVFENCPRFPDYAHPIITSLPSTGWTATKDCYITMEAATASSQNHYLKIDGNTVAEEEGTYWSGPNITYCHSSFSGYVKKGQVINFYINSTGTALSNFKAFPLI